MKAMVAAVVFLGGAVGLALWSCGDDEARNTVANDGGLREDGAAPDGALRDSATGDAADASVPLTDSCGDAAAAVPDVWLADPHLCLTVFAKDLAINRQLAFAPNGDLFVHSAGKVKALVDSDHDGFVSEAETLVFAGSIEGEQELNHGLAFSPDGAFVYSSSELVVYRWPYQKGDHVATGPAEVVVHGVPGGAGHSSRTLTFDAQGRLYMNVGSAGDVDEGAELRATRSQIRRFVIPPVLPTGGLDYTAGEVYAHGLRNEVGLAFDSKGRMWGVENGSDGVYLPDHGIITQDNPAEELNRLDAPGTRFFGYPLCWSTYAIDGGPPAGTQWAYFGYPDGPTDAWCRDRANVQPPAFAMQGHWAALGITEYAGGSLPWKGDLFVASHGSSYRDPPTGRLIARAHVVGDTIESVTPIVGHAVDGGLEQGTWDARPVDIKSGPDGALYFSDDTGYRVFRLGYRP